MKEKDIRQEIFRLARSLGYWPITQTDLYTPFPAAKANRLLGALLKSSKPYPGIYRNVCALRNVLTTAAGKPPIGRPDILWLHPYSSSRVSEVKVVPRGKKSFPFNSIRPEQRKWLDAWEEADGIGYIAVGTLEPRRRRLWLIDWPAWKQVEEMIRPYQNSIPVVAGKGMLRVLQENGLDMSTLLASYELARVSGGWRLPEGHSAHPDLDGEGR